MNDVIDTIIDKEEQGSVQGAFDWYNDHLIMVTSTLDECLPFSVIKPHQVTVLREKDPKTNKSLISFKCQCGASYIMAER